MNTVKKTNVRFKEGLVFERQVSVDSQPYEETEIQNAVSILESIYWMERNCPNQIDAQNTRYCLN